MFILISIYAEILTNSVKIIQILILQHSLHAEL